MIYKYFDENMTLDDIFNGKASKCDGKHIHHINCMSFDNRIENLKIMLSVQEHKEHHKNTSLNICFNHETNKFTLTNSFKTVIAISKWLKKDFKGELPSDNEDYQMLYNELENYLEINKDILQELNS